MSLPWNKFVQLHVGQRAVRGSLRRAWAPAKTLNQSRCAIAESANDPADSDFGIPSPDRVAAIETVLTALAQEPHSHADRLRVLMADSLVHFDVVSGDFGAASERDLQAIARACVAEMLGERAADQVIRWQLQPGERHLLISSMHQSTVAAMVQTASQYGLTLDSLQPEFNERWNRHTASLSGSTGVFASMDDVHVIVCLVQHGVITALSHGPVPVDEPKDTATKGDLDGRTDRLLASVGHDASAMASYVLVTLEGAGLGASPRWTRIDLAEEGA